MKDEARFRALAANCVFGRDRVPDCNSFQAATFPFGGAIIPNSVADRVVRWPADRLVPDRRRTVSAYPLQQPTDLAPAQVKHMRRRHHCHTAASVSPTKPRSFEERARLTIHIPSSTSQPPFRTGTAPIPTFK